MHSRKILIITYYWPPSGGVGVQRWMNYAIQLQKNGWSPIVYTPENPQFDVRDSLLTEEVKDIPVIKLPIWEPFDLFHKLTGNKERKNVQQGLVMEKTKKSVMDRLFVWIRGNLLLPDPRVFWVKRSVAFLKAFVQDEKIGTIVTTGPPHSMHLIGRSLKKKTCVKWLADFRDPWSKWDVLQKLDTSSLALKAHAWLEQSVLREADAVTTVSKRLAQSFEALCGSKVHELNNGISFDQMEGIESEPFTIGYFGTLNELRNPHRLWQLLDQMCRENDVFAQQLKIRIGGIIASSIKDEILRLEYLKDRVQFLGYLEHRHIMREYKVCNVLLLLQNKSDNAQWILPVKFFEYLTAGRMILGLTNEKGDLGDLFEGKDIGELVNYEDIAGIRHFLVTAFEEGKLPDKKDTEELMHSFSHETLVGKLQGLLSQMHH